MKSLVIATITNHGVKVGDTSYCYGVPDTYFPSPRIPGAIFKLSIEFVGTDPEMKPELHAFWPSSSFGSQVASNEKEIAPLMAECRRNIRSKNPNPEKGWWKKRLAKFETDLRNIAQARKDYSAAVRLWKKHLIK